MRAQAHTLEGFVASLVILGTVAFALQATAVTPLSASTSNQQIENQQMAISESLLETLAEQGELKPAVLYWNTSRNEFRDSGPRGTFSNGGPPTPFGAALNETFGDGNIAFNVDVVYRSPDESRNTVSMVDMGTPSDNAATASRTVVLFDDDTIEGTNRTVANASAQGDYYAEDVDPDGELFNVMEVRIVVWRI
ncbi:DUF7288 family protein [Haloparvum sp. PAK95]|uniref:DUF7288 family protein n=1 Tax=Haloparvum sp. PAK95 TaxID=3418962 RepID=UPI003D2EB290